MSDFVHDFFFLMNEMADVTKCRFIHRFISKCKNTDVTTHRIQCKQYLECYSSYEISEHETCTNVVLFDRCYIGRGTPLSYYE